MPSELRIEHRYPEALAFLRRHGPEAVAVVHDEYEQTCGQYSAVVMSAEFLALVARKSYRSSWATRP
ncbi:MAG: hypothetical protein M3P53_00200 [Actinomycetota bacterium]|nr:hypothetical protein [Actinomycetota bacterium]